ncbi:MAG TPA: hypothetical protein VLJ20_08435, partial [Acetobacteraceae bacterium]|nr:hypothetical protein [Acetobacteraceae bacterium]
MGHHAPHPAAPTQPGAHLSEPPATLGGPPEPGEDEIEAGRRLFAAECRFMLGVVTADHLPPP